MWLNDEKITLRAIEEEDCSVLKKLINDPETEKMVLGWSFPVSTKEQLKWIETAGNDQKTKRFIVQYEDIAVGIAILSQIDFKNSNASLGIKLCSEKRGKGIGSRVIGLLVRYCFDELNLHCLTATILEYNIASQKLYEKAGFKKEAVLKDRIYKNGKYNDVFVYSIISKGI